MLCDLKKSTQELAIILQTTDLMFESLAAILLRQENFEYDDHKIFSVKSKTPDYTCKHWQRDLLKEKQFFLKIMFGQLTSYESTTSLAITDAKEGLVKNSLSFLTEINQRKWSSYYLTIRLK